MAGFLPDEIWRWLGIVLGRSIDEKSEAALRSAQLPSRCRGCCRPSCDHAALGVRPTYRAVIGIGAIAAGLTGFLLPNRSLLAGMLAAPAVLIRAAVSAP